MATTYTILNRGLIPVILKHGPMSGVKLDHMTLVQLVSRGVTIVDDSTSKLVTMMDLATDRVVKPTGKAMSEPEAKPITVPAGPNVMIPHPPELDKDPVEPEPGTMFPREPASDDADGEPEAPQLPVPPGMDPPVFEEKLEEASEPGAETEDEAELKDGEAEVSEIPAGVPVPQTGTDPYAGMSRNQRKKARKAAEAAARTGTQK